jgi:chemotaxis signal transduction protein
VKEQGSQPTRLVEQNAALSRLLQDLLGEVPEDPGQSVEARPECSAHSALNDPVDRPLKGESEGAAGMLAPRWGAVAFRALLFRVGEQRFAMPLIALHSVALFEQQATVLPGQPQWQIGIVHYRDQCLRIADTASLLGLSDSGRSTPRYLLVLGEGQLALACDRIDDAIEVSGDAVRWRQAEGPVQWLVGILVDSLAAVLDPWIIEQELGMDHA